MLSTFSRLHALVYSLSLAFAIPSFSAVLLQDSFDNNNVAVPNVTTIGNWGGGFGTNATEANGKLTVRTVNAQASSSTNFSTAVSSQLNPFTHSIQFAVTDFSLFGIDTYASESAGRFRIGLTSTGGSFFSSDDAFALEINQNGKGFRLGTVFNNTAGDPNSANGNQTFTSAITDFTFTFTATSWSLQLYSGAETLYDNTGTWSLGDPSLWGAGSNNDGSSSLILALQNSGGGTDPTGYKSFSIGSIEVSATAIPEPSRLLLLTLALSAMVMRRRRA
jgi:hypothetical protein